MVRYDHTCICTFVHVDGLNLIQQTPMCRLFLCVFEREREREKEREEGERERGLRIM